MGITFTRKGYIQVLRDGVVLSEHVEERKAVQSLSEREDGDYVLRYPDVAVTVILRKSDTTPPAVPSGFSASAATATSVTLTLTANVESDFSNYVLERSSDNIGWGYLKSFTGTSTTDTVDVSNSVYYYRVFAIDTRGNRSAYTAVKSAGPYTVNLSWNGTIPTITFTRGNAQNFDLSPYIIGEPTNIVLNTGTLPPGVTLNAAQKRLQYDATSASNSSIVETNISFRLVGGVETVTTLSVSSSVGSTVPWTFGQAFKQGDVPTGYYITTSLANSQAHVRNRWPDGSVKYAVLSGRGTGSIDIQKTAIAPSGTNISEHTAGWATNVSVTLTGTGAGTYTPGPAITAGTGTWNRTTARKVREFLGPVMSEFHYYSPTSDSHITIWWYVRVYSDRTEVETVIENGWLKLASPATKSYGVTVAIAGSTVYTGSLTHNHHSRWSRVDWIGTDPQCIPTHNLTYLRSTRMVPNYGWTSPTASAYTGFYTTTNPVPYTDWGNYQEDITGTGSSPWIGLLPDWDTFYLTAGHETAYKAMVSNARIVGRYGHHFRDETTGRPVDWRSYTTGQSGGSGPLLINVSTWPVSASGTAAPQWELAHHGSVGYVPYLVTGRWTMLEELQFSATWAISRSDVGTAGVVEPVTGAWTTRGGAWAWRTIGQAAAISPTQISGETTVQAACAASIDATTTYLYAKYIDAGGSVYNTIGYLGQYDGQVNADTYRWGRNWMVSFQIAALAHISDLGIENIDQTDLEVVRNHAYQGILRQIVPGTNSQWNWRHLAQYDAPYTTGGGTLLTTAQAYSVYTAAFGSLSDSAPAVAYYDGSAISDQNPSTTGQGYGMYKIACLAMAIDHGVTNAQTAYNTLATATNMTDEFLPTASDDAWHDNPRWGIVPR